VAARPALVDVSVPATGRFVEALADAQDLATPTEPADPRRREQFAAAVDRAVAAWDEARRTAESLADRPDPAPTLAPGAAPTAERDEYAAVADAVRQAAARGMRDLRHRMRA
jgi:hypothetical protein